MGKFLVSMAIFHSYVNLPEGIPSIGSSKKVAWKELAVHPRLTWEDHSVVRPFHQEISGLVNVQETMENHHVKWENSLF